MAISGRVFVTKKLIFEEKTGNEVQGHQQKLNTIYNMF